MRAFFIWVPMVCFFIFTPRFFYLDTFHFFLKMDNIDDTIPASVMKIAMKSCAECHTEPGDGMALLNVNFLKWDKYTPREKAIKAKDICKMISTNQMPPESFLKDKPDTKPTREDKKILCDWAGSLK